jgi:hypothetical protein
VTQLEKVEKDTMELGEFWDCKRIAGDGTELS